MTADLLAVLREALPELRAVASTIQDCAEISAHSSWADRIDTALARIDSALSAHEPMGWRPIADCAGRDTAPTTADAGVTEAMVETFEAKFLECARTRPDSTLRDDIRAALVAALGARKGE